MSECKNSCKDCKCNEVSDPERRRFMGWMIGIFNGIVGIAVIGPVIGFIGAPLKLRSKPIWVDVIGLDEIVDGETKYAGQSLPTRALRGDGKQFYVELSFAIVRDDDGKVAGALATARDITERFEQDRASRRRLAELEESLKELQGSGT